MIRLFLISLLIYCSTVNFYGQDFSFYKKGLFVYKHGNYKKAINYFNNTIIVSPEHAAAHYYRGFSYMQIKLYNEAEKDFKKALKLNYSIARTYSALGRLNNEKEEYKKAIKWLTKAISANSTFAEAYNNRGFSYHRLGNFKQAIDNYNKAIAIDNTFALAYCNRGTARYYNQNLAKPHRKDILMAIADFDKAIEYKPQITLAIKNKGVAYRLLGELDSSLIYLSINIKKEPYSPEAYLERARTYFEMDNYTNAIEDFKSVLKYNPLLADAYIERGICKSKLGYYNDAITDQLKALEIKPDTKPIVFYNLACNYALMNEKEMMLYHLKQCKRFKYFKTQNKISHFIEDSDFDNYRNDEDFERFISKLKSGNQ